MNIFAREPIFDTKQNLFAYQLVFKDGKQGALPEHLTIEHDQTKLESAHELHDASIGLKELLSGFVTVISISRDATLNSLPSDINTNDTILEITTLGHNDSELIEAIRSHKRQGFKIATQYCSDMDPLNFELADFLKVNIDHISLQDFQTLLLDIKQFNLQTIATGVQSLEQYQKCVEAGFNYLQGYFFLNRQHKQQDQLPASKLSLLTLLAQTADSSIDMDKIRVTFEQDATLSYLLMRFINNPLINKSHKITSIKHALTYLGELMIRKFIAIISIAQLNEENAEELLQVSLVRAKYCELLDEKIAGSVDAMSAFTTGLFSLIDVILDRDMKELLTQIPLSNNINLALLKQKGPYHPMLKSVKALESSNWLGFHEAGKALELEQEVLQECYLEAVKWNNLLRHSGSDMFPQAKA